MANNNNALKYFARDFESLKPYLIDYAKTRHPDKFAYINDNSPDILWIELLAYIGDTLNYQVDKTFNESFRTKALAKESLIRMANSQSFTEFGPKAAVGSVVFTITVPYYVDNQGIKKPNPDLLISFRRGASLISDSGQQFETLEEVNFADIRNRKIIPQLDGSGNLLNYKIEKQVKVRAGQSKIQRIYISADKAKPFYTVTLDDSEVTEIISVVIVENSNTYLAPSDSEFEDDSVVWHQVDYLAENKKFFPINPSALTPTELSDFTDSGIRAGEWTEIPKRFIVRRDINNLVTLTFGAGTPNIGDYESSLDQWVDLTSFSLNQVLNNPILGKLVPLNSTMFIKYRNGGGIKTNVSVDGLKTIGSIVYYPIPNINNTSINLINQVRQSMTVTNIVPCIGGRDAMSIEEIRNTLDSFIPANNRFVVYKDLAGIIESMPAKFGRPFRYSLQEMKPKVANYSIIKSNLNRLLNLVKNASTQTQRNLYIQEIDNFLETVETTGVYNPNNGSRYNNPITVSEYSSSLLTSIPSLWIGEKCRLSIIGIDEQGSLTTKYKDNNGIWISPNDTLKQNIKRYLVDKRVIGDWIDIIDGDIINIQIEFSVLTNSSNPQQVLSDCLIVVRDYFNNLNWNMGQPIYLSSIKALLQQISSVITVADLKIYNIWGEDNNSGRKYAPIETGRYGNLVRPQTYVSSNRYEMIPQYDTFVLQPNQIFEVKYPDIDIIGSVIQ